MKLIIQIPCLNEEGTLEETLRDLPAEVPGFDRVEILVVDDGSTDRTVEVAKEAGAHHVVSLPGNRGLAAAFSTGLETALALGADVIVNTDGDNQYCGQDVPALVRPILEEQCDMVIGDRQPGEIAHFSWVKRRLQTFGSRVVRRFSGVQTPDATSGFRAFSRQAALKLVILSPFSYTLESIIQASRKGLRVTAVPIRTNPKTRESRLMRSTTEFVFRSAATILRVSVFYSPLRFFLILSAILFLPGVAIGARFLYFYLTGSGSGHVQSLILGGVLLTMGFLTFALAIIADLVSVNRRLVEETLYRIRRLEAGRFSGDLKLALGARLWSRDSDA